MSYDAKVFNVMIASPNDVSKERWIIREVIAGWNSIYSNNTGLVMLPVGWETHSYPRMGNRPQQIINKQILERSDLLVAVFWTRLGTATGEAASGTVEEINRHVEAQKPAMIYFSSAPVQADSIEQEQYAALLKFKEECKKKGFFEEYEDIAEFKEKFTKQFQLIVLEDFVTEASAPNKPGSSQFPPPDIPSLTEEAKELLLEAAEDTGGDVIMIRTSSGFSVTTNNRQFMEDCYNARLEATWKGAINELCKKELFEPRGRKGQIFAVTREGYRIADFLKQVR